MTTIEPLEDIGFIDDDFLNDARPINLTELETRIDVLEGILYDLLNELREPPALNSSVDYWHKNLVRKAQELFARLDKK
jgi:hypothetical protein